MLQSNAQQLIVVEPEGNLIPLQVEEVHPDYEEVIEVAEQPLELEVVMELPGAPSGTKDPEPLEVSDDEEEEVADENDAQTKVTEKWNWSKHGPTGFVAWVKERMTTVPKHSGYDTAGIQRAQAYLEKLDAEISKAMRMDLDAELDADEIEKVRAIIDNGVEKLQDRLDKIKSSKKKSRKKKSDVIPDSLVKEAQKITGVKGTFVTVPLLISGIARVIVNGTISAGHDTADLFDRLSKKYKLNDREKDEVKWLLFDMGFPIRGDRGYMIDEDYDQAGTDGFDYAQNFRG